MSNQYPNKKAINGEPTFGQKLKVLGGLTDPETTGHTYNAMRLTPRRRAAAGLAVVAGLGALKGFDYRMNVIESERKQERQELIDAGWTPTDPVIDGTDEGLLPPKQVVEPTTPHEN